MAIEKQLLIPGKRYRSRNSKGEKADFVASPEVIDEIFKTGNDLIAHGYDIPVPFEHDLDLLLSIGGRKKGGLVNDLHRNAGFVKKFVKNEDGSLSAILDIPNKQTAEKLGKEIRGASLTIAKEFVDTDVDRNRRWKMAPLHLALTNKPVVTGTRTFQEVPDALLLSMDEEELDGSNKESTDTDDVVENETPETGVSANQDRLLNELRKALKSKFGIELSATTTQDNLLEHLALIIPNVPKMVPESSLQKEELEDPIDPEEKQKVEDEIETKPEGAKTHQGPSETGAWAMSLEQENESLKAQISVLLSRQSETASKNFRIRAEALKKQGVSKDVLDARVFSILDRKNDKGEIVLLSQSDEMVLENVLGVLEETVAKNNRQLDDDEDYLLSQQHIPNAEEDQDEDEMAWKEIKKNLKYVS